MRARTLALGLAGALALAGGPAHANHTLPTPGNCVIAASAAGAANPQLTDATGDYEGLLGNGNGGAGDIYREGTDLTAAWFTTDANGAHAVSQVVSLIDPQPNAVYYFQWQYPDDDPAPPNKSERYAVARFKGYAPTVFEYGHLETSITGGTLFVADGPTTGTITAGALGTISVDVPLALMGNPGAGEYLVDLIVDSGVLVGSPERLPPPSPFRHGLIEPADTTTDGPQACDVAL